GVGICRRAVHLAERLCDAAVVALLRSLDLVLVALAELTRGLVERAHRLHERIVQRIERACTFAALDRFVERLAHRDVRERASRNQLFCARSEEHTSELQS